ncbi:hypothetical protein FN846DRAFT_556000 [Sphaerosporella brunnea]|uniref:Uncharacterized protein n=1 Tax=Sphaerosporella brunnea TaxID=1250544 RepID=A0A5J5ED93_9PEZI|nr:hypothetical protein FN846DRAFT_556000 [Sphaerosporella brunnea]
MSVGVTISGVGIVGMVPCSDAHESSILPEVLGLASIFLPRNRLALLEPYSITLAYARHSFSVLALFLTPLDATRGYLQVGHTARRPSTHLVLDSRTRVHHWFHSCSFGLGRLILVLVRWFNSVRFSFDFRPASRWCVSSVLVCFGFRRASMR